MLAANVGRTTAGPRPGKPRACEVAGPGSAPTWLATRVVSSRPRACSHSRIGRPGCSCSSCAQRATCSMTAAACPRLACRCIGTASAGRMGCTAAVGIAGGEVGGRARSSSAVRLRDPIGGHDQVDGGAAGAAGVAVPALLAAGRGEDRDRRGAPGLRLVGGTRPGGARTAAAARSEELVGQRRQIGRARGSRRGKVGSRRHAGVGVAEVAARRGRWTCWTTAVRPPIFHSARPLARRGSSSASVAVRSSSRAASRDLVGGLAEQHPGLGVGEQAHRHLRGGGAVVGLGAQVREPVDDREVGDAVGRGRASSTPGGTGGAFGAEQRTTPRRAPGAGAARRGGRAPPGARRSWRASPA